MLIIRFIEILFEFPCEVLAIGQQSYVRHAVGNEGMYASMYLKQWEFWLQHVYSKAAAGSPKRAVFQGAAHAAKKTAKSVTTRSPSEKARGLKTLWHACFYGDGLLYRAGPQNPGSWHLPS